jgi:hypothetical protein
VVPGRSYQSVAMQAHYMQRLQNVVHDVRLRCRWKFLKKEFAQTFTGRLKAVFIKFDDSMLYFYKIVAFLFKFCLKNKMSKE